MGADARWTVPDRELVPWKEWLVLASRREDHGEPASP